MVFHRNSETDELTQDWTVGVSLSYTIGVKFGHSKEQNKRSEKSACRYDKQLKESLDVQRSSLQVPSYWDFRKHLHTLRRRASGGSKRKMRERNWLFGCVLCLEVAFYYKLVKVKSHHCHGNQDLLSCGELYLLPDIILSFYFPY